MKKTIFVLPVIAGMMMFSCGSEEVTTDGEGSTSEEHVDGEAHDHDHDHENMEEVTGEALTFNETEFLVYGENKEFDPSNAVSIDSMYATVTANGNAEMVVKGEINQICQKAGCWIDVQTTDGNTMMVFFKDHFTLPIEGSKGKEVIFHGVGQMDTTTIEFQKHLLDDRAEKGEEVSQEAYDAITEDIVEPSFTADGIMVINQ